jgi:hypothetical protein
VRIFVIFCISCILIGCNSEISQDSISNKKENQQFRKESDIDRGFYKLSSSYLFGIWTQDGYDCENKYAIFTYTKDQHLVIDGEREPYRIEGNRIIYNNPVDGNYAETFDEVDILGPDIMRLRLLNMDWIELRRCPATGSSFE